MINNEYLTPAMNKKMQQLDRLNTRYRRYVWAIKKRMSNITKEFNKFDTIHLSNDGSGKYRFYYYEFHDFDCSMSREHYKINDLCKDIGIDEKEFLELMVKEYGGYTYSAYDWYLTFDEEEDAKRAFDWVQARFIMKKLENSK
jgi:hypothetical protein